MPFKGVTKTPGGRFRAEMCIAGRTKHLGIFDSPEEAAREYDRRATAAYGEFAKTNAAMGLLAGA